MSNTRYHQSNGQEVIHVEVDTQSGVDIVEEPQGLERHELVRIEDDIFAVKFFIFQRGPSGISFTGRLFFPAVFESLHALGYYKRMRQNETFMLIKEMANIIKEVDPSYIKNEFYSVHLKNQDQPLYFLVDDTPITLSVEAQQQAYLKQSNQIFNQRFLEHLDTHTKPALMDDRNNSHFFFRGKISIASIEGIETMEYSELDGVCIWQDHMIDHEFEFDQNFQDAHYPTFIRNVSRNEAQRLNGFYSAIGYLLNNYNLPSKSQAVICYDEVPSETGDPNGGTGKGVFCKAVKQLRKTFKLDGKNIWREDKFKFQGITEQTQIFWVDDVTENFPFEMLHSCITDGFTVEKKRQDQFFIPPEESPKVIICSNTILSAGGKTNIRRQFILEFGDFYSRQIITGAEEPIKETHGGLFFDQESWDQTEWNKFFSFMIWCAQYYLINGLKPYTQVGMERSRLIQMTAADFIEWLNQRNLQLEEEYENSVLYNEYCEFSGCDKTLFRQRTFTKWIGIYAETQGWTVTTRPSNGKRYTRLDSK